MFFGLFKSKEEKLLEKFGWKFYNKDKEGLVVLETNWRKGDFLITLFDKGWAFHTLNYKCNDFDIDNPDEKITENDLIEIDSIIKNV